MASNIINQLVIKGWILGSLVIGFLVTIIVPRLVIEKLGDVSYGIYALIAGYASILAMGDLGLIPGVTREFSRAVAAGNLRHVRAILGRLDNITLKSIAVLGALCLGITRYALKNDLSDSLTATIILIVIGYSSIKIEISTALLRAMGHVQLSYLFRIVYFAIYSLTIWLLYIYFTAWSVALVFLAQLFAMVGGLLILNWKICRLLGVKSSVFYNNGHYRDADTEAAWADIWRISLAERLNKTLQFLNGLIERPLILAVGGLGLVGSFDLMMRLMLVVSAVPGALNQPLLAMLSHDSARDAGERKFPHALRLTRLVGAVTATLGVAVAVSLFTFYHEKIFGIVSLIPIHLGILIALSSGINVLTAPGSAVFISRGIIWPCSVKSIIEFVGLAIGIGCGVFFRDAFVFIGFRYTFLLASAIFFLIVEANSSGN